MGKETSILPVRAFCRIGIKPDLDRSFGQDGATDVTEAYVSDWSGECQRRRAARGWKEAELKKVSIQCNEADEAAFDGGHARDEE